jgi:hypothetical protein
MVLYYCTLRIIPEIEPDPRCLSFNNFVVLQLWHKLEVTSTKARSLIVAVKLSHTIRSVGILKNAPIVPLLAVYFHHAGYSLITAMKLDNKACFVVWIEQWTGFASHIEKICSL